MRIHRAIVRRLLHKPRELSRLYRVLFYPEHDVDTAMKVLLDKGIVGVTAKRFYIRNYSEAMAIANQIG